MKARLPFLVLASAAVIAACGGGTKTVVHTVAPPGQVTGPSPGTANPCPADRSTMGCATPLPQLRALPKVALPSGVLFPDVSVWQGPVNWTAAAAWQRQHGWAPFAVYKMGEYSIDTQAVRNSQQTRANKVATWGYWFVRNTGCQHESQLIISTARQLALKRVILDTEVPEARGYDACLAPPLRNAGLTVAEYTSPGSNPDTANPGLGVWTASFGPAHTPCVWTCSVGQLDRQTIIAWQFSDGKFGPVVSIPGIGAGDVSVDYGMTRLPVPAPKPPSPPSGAKQSSVELQAQGILSGSAQVTVTKGHWTVKGTGRWRVRSLPFNAPPLGK